jgi:hypothetical protein
VTVIETVQTAHGFIVSDRTSYRGLPRVPVATLRNSTSNGKSGSSAISSARFASGSAITFSDFNASHVTIPASNDIVTRATVATRKIGDDHLAVFKWLSGEPLDTTTGFDLTNGSGTQIDGGSGGPTAAPIPEPSGLFPEGGGSSGPESWSDVTVSVSGSVIADVRLVIDGKTADAMVPAKLASGRFVILLAKVPRESRVSIQGLNESGDVITSTPYSW